MGAAKAASEAPLATDISTDVCIVGAGMAGLSVAYELSKRGREVVVVDDGTPGCGETSRTTAHLSNSLDDRYFEVEKLHGKEGSRLAAESHSRAIDRIEEIIKQEGIDCDFTRLDGYLFAEDAEGIEELDSELGAAQRAGLTSVQRVDLPLIANHELTPCLRFPGQAQFHVMKYLTGLVAAIRTKWRTHLPTYPCRLDGRRRRRCFCLDQGNRGLYSYIPLFGCGHQFPSERLGGDSYKTGCVSKLCCRSSSCRGSHSASTLLGR